MKILAEEGEQANDRPTAGGAVRRRPLENVECPLTVREAARFLGVSPQTVYLWVERKQIPHLRVMGRNIRFLKSDNLPCFCNPDNPDQVPGFKIGYRIWIRITYI